MNAVLLVVGSAFAVLAGLIHVVIFYLESIAWARPATWRRFGLRSQADAEVVRPMAFNQGFYNLFLGIGAIVGVVLLASGATAAGYAVTLFATLSMLAAAAVLILSSPKLARAAIIQGALPLLAVAFLLLAPVG